MEQDHGQDHKGQQVVQRVKPVQGRIADGKAAPQERDNVLPDQRYRREQVGNHRGGPVAHLAPGQHIPHKGRHDRQYQNDDTEYPQQFARLLIGAIVEPAEHVDVEQREKHRRPVHMGVAQQPAVIDVAHDPFDRVERQ